MKRHSQMAIERFEQRKLAAIMFTDMVGYSALAQRDEGLALEFRGTPRALAARVPQTSRTRGKNDRRRLSG